jgi:hypothetical protein
MQSNDVQSKVLRTLVYCRAYDTTVTIETKEISAIAASCSLRSVWPVGQTLIVDSEITG